MLRGLLHDTQSRDAMQREVSQAAAQTKLTDAGLERLQIGVQLAAEKGVTDTFLLPHRERVVRELAARTAKRTKEAAEKRKKAGAFLARGHECHRAGKIEEARSSFLRAHAVDGQAVALFSAANMAARLGRREEALREYRTLGEREELLMQLSSEQKRFLARKVEQTADPGAVMTFSPLPTPPSTPRPSSAFFGGGGTAQRIDTSGGSAGDGEGADGSAERHSAALRIQVIAYSYLRCKHATYCILLTACFVPHIAYFSQAHPHHILTCFLSVSFSIHTPLGPHRFQFTPLFQSTPAFRSRHTLVGRGPVQQSLPCVKCGQRGKRRCRSRPVLLLRPPWQL